MLTGFTGPSINEINIPCQYPTYNSFHLFNNFLYAKEPDKSNSGTESVAYKNYENLKSLYQKWNKSIIKNKQVYRQLAGKYLAGIRDEDVFTDYDYFFIAPEAVYGKRIVCYFILDEWLRIKGNVALESLAAILGEKPEVLTKWWRSRKLVSMQGRLEKFELETDQNGEEIIVLHMEDFKLKGINDANTGENSK